MYEVEIEESVKYLNSREALSEAARDPYWPKWDSPWWHMLLLYEMGETRLIPEPLIRTFVKSLDSNLIHYFPLTEKENKELPQRSIPCHCQIGCVYKVLATWGVEVDIELPWLRRWLLSYQMADGGHSCDYEAYLVTDETPSSMVGTIHMFEALLNHTHRPFTPEEKSVLDKAAQFLISRKLINGSQTEQNAAERKSALDWPKLCFPRYYFYDVLKGLSALTTWSEKTKQTIPLGAIEEALELVRSQLIDGQLRIGRQPFPEKKTLMPTPSGEWIKPCPTTTFALLNKVSSVGEVSPYLNNEWKEIERRLQGRPVLDGR